MRRRLLLAIIAFSLLAPMVHAFTFFNPLFAWVTAPGKGTFYLNGVTTFSGWTLTGGVYLFNDTNMGGTAMFGDIGFSVETNVAEATLSLIEDRHISFNMVFGAVAHTYVWSATAPTSVTGGTFVYNPATHISDVSTNGNVVVEMFWGTVYTIDIATTMPTVEAGMKSLLYANCTDSIGVTHNGTVTFSVEGAPFHWVAARSRYEATPMKSIPQTVTFDTVTAFHDSADSGASGVVNTAAVVTWTNNRIDTIVTPAAAGNLPGVLWAMTTYEVGATLVYTFMAFALSVAVWNHSGPEPVLVLWLLMWGSWVAVVQGTAAEIGIVLLVLGGGTLTAKIYLDRRSLG